MRSLPVRLRLPIAQAPDLDELEAEALDLLEHPVERGLVLDRAAQDRLGRLDLGLEAREPVGEALPDATPDANLVPAANH
jgi:hypothetical protein